MPNSIFGFLNWMLSGINLDYAIDKSVAKGAPPPKFCRLPGDSLAVGARMNAKIV
jgi:hypothetical protein